MSDDMVQWAQSPIGVGEGVDTGLTAYVEETMSAPPAYERKIRSRPNRGRIKRTNRTPGLSEPPWDMLREMGVPIPPNLQCLPYTPVNWRRGGLYLNWRKQVHARWGHTCHLCGHEGAYTADHLIPVSVWSNQPYDPGLARPAHGVEGCPTCKVPCNSSRGNKAIAKSIGQYKPPIAL